MSCIGSKDTLLHDNIMTDCIINKYKNIPMRVSTYTTNLKFNNLTDIPIELYLDVNKVILTVQDFINMSDSCINMGDLLEFICMNFTNLEKIKFVDVHKHKYYHGMPVVFKAINKLALLEKLLYIRICFANKFLKYMTYGAMSVNVNVDKICSYMENMTIFTFPNDQFTIDNFTIPSNIKKLKILEMSTFYTNILSNLKIGLTHLQIKIIDHHLDEILNSINLPCTMEELHVLVYINWMYGCSDEQTDEQIIIKHKKNIEQRIKLPFGCKLIITTHDSELSSTMSDDEDFNEFNDFDDYKMYENI